MKPIWSIIIAILCATAAWGQQQQEPDIGQLSIEVLMKVKIESVYGASKFLEKVSDAVTIVTAEEIERYGSLPGRTSNQREAIGAGADCRPSAMIRRFP